jgi:replicative DNA helicase
MDRIIGSTKRVFMKLDDRFKATGGVTGAITGVPSLDSAGGIHPGEIIVVAGQPSSGKTAFAISLGLGAAREGTDVLYFALAETGDEIGERALVCESKVANTSVRRGYLTREDMTNLTHAAVRLKDLPFSIEEAADMTAAALRETVCKWRSSCTCARALIIVDYVQLLCPEHSTGNRDYEMAAAIRTLVNTAKASIASIVLVSQLSRRGADRADPRPRLVDLRESGALEAAATAVLFIHAPDDRDMPHEVILAKHRRRGNTVDDFYFDPSTGTFTLVDQAQGQQPAH